MGVCRRVLVAMSRERTVVANKRSGNVCYETAKTRSSDQIDDRAIIFAHDREMTSDGYTILLFGRGELLLHCGLWGGERVRRDIVWRRSGRRFGLYAILADTWLPYLMHQMFYTKVSRDRIVCPSDLSLFRYAQRRQD